jgi:hypothetical protein
MLAIGFAGALGLAWDESWHATVGRNTFLTPPHILLYGSTAAAGLLCLGPVPGSRAGSTQAAPKSTTTR